MGKIKVLSLQFTPVKADKQANLKKIVSLIEQDGKSAYDLIVLPEFFDVGINLSNKEFCEFAEDDESGVIYELSKLAKKYNTYIHCGSILFKTDEGCKNCAILLDRKGAKVAQYNKIHLFDYLGGNEGAYTIAGSELCVVDTDFGKVGLATCFDLRFAQMFTELMKLGAEIFVVPAAWSVIDKVSEQDKKHFISNWQTITVARAYDNIAYIVTSNEVGNVRPMFEGIGNSMIVDFDGNVLANAGHLEKAIFAELDLKALRKMRKSFPIQKIS